MRFMMIVKHAENQGPPPKALIDAITKASDEAVKNGAMLGNGGLGPTAQGARVRLSGGRVTVIDGPFTEAKEVVGGYAQFELKSKQEAVESAASSWNYTRNTGQAGRVRPRSARCWTRKIVPPESYSSITVSARTSSTHSARRHRGELALMK